GGFADSRRRNCEPAGSGDERQPAARRYVGSAGELVGRRVLSPVPSVARTVRLLPSAILPSPILLRPPVPPVPPVRLRVLGPLISRTAGRHRIAWVRFAWEMRRPASRDETPLAKRRDMQNGRQRRPATQLCSSQLQTSEGALR